MCHIKCNAEGIKKNERNNFVMLALGFGQVSLDLF